MRSEKSFYLWIELMTLILGIMGMIFPYMSAASFYGTGELSLLNGSSKPLAYIGIAVMLITAVVQYFKPQWWLIAICAAFAFIPWFSTIGIEDAGQGFVVAKRESGAYLSILSSFILTICFVIEFCLYIRYMKRPQRLLYIGIEFLIMGALAVWIYPVVDIIGAVLIFVAAPVFILLSILGFIFAKRHKPENLTDEDLISDTTEYVRNENSRFSDKKFFILLGVVLGVWSVILLGLRSISPSVEDLKNYKEVIAEEALVYSTEEDKENGIEPIATIRKGNKVEVRFVDEPWVVMRYKDAETGECVKGFMLYDDLDFSGEEQLKDTNPEVTNQVNKNATPEDNDKVIDTYLNQEEEVEDDWDATTSVDWEGTINGKWNIEMTVHRLDGMVWGSYCYTKNKTSISLDGQWGENYQLTLTESVDGNVTGQFIGTYGEDAFDGIWVSADGEKEYPFSLKPVYKVEP